ncbi:MAG: hypothetical protein IKL13_03345 [Clostridia bacterium]|nr:hypothetical protein [Clostridia bacterium]
MKKRWLALFLALLILAVCITACDKYDAVDDGDSDDAVSDETSVKVTLVLVPADENDRIILGSADPIGAALGRRLKNNGIDEWSMMTSEEDNRISVKFIAESKAQAQEMADKLCPRGEVTLLFYEGDDTITGADGSVAPLGVLILDSRNVTSVDAMYVDYSADEPDPQPVISLTFDEVGAAAFAAATEKLAGKGKISVWLDFGKNWAEQNQSSRYQKVQTFDVFEPITEGEALLTGFEDMAEAEELADLITGGFLPFDLKIKSIRFK